LGVKKSFVLCRSMYMPATHSVYWLQLTRLVTLVLACFGGDGAGRMRLMGARAEEAVGECFPGGLGGGP